eukprot:CAMPEP_0171505042 /NCGR_PEP_ID=MMETSP0958-20121227/11961_1 /TAXON_ID=87120 /ORGANISM="Aurantiochytrium limacinum, Strain ATCCMYA-1381" /LENGTH=225 /DNA_ID=CAMNT_0012041059 /DNA_START=32 /DNA_END=704 /DNA_ORIENTATION=-
MSAASGPVKVFGAILSQPTRAVLWTCKLVGIDSTLEKLDSTKGEQTSAEYLKLNPNGKFPVLVDGSFVLCESHAIMRYLVDKFADKRRQDELYPMSNLQQRLQAYTGALSLSKISDMSKHSARLDLEQIPMERDQRVLTSSLNIMEDQLNKTPFIAGTNHVTLADIALFTEVDQLQMLDPKRTPPNGSDFHAAFPAISAWSESFTRNLMLVSTEPSKRSRKCARP